MRLLHTADWHLGLRLYKRDITEEHRRFFDWLLELIRTREIDVLMISGDVFDQANPTNEARTLYYDFLLKLISIPCKVIITGGNHDSPGVLNAPRELLKKLDIHVVGNLPDDPSLEMIPVNDPSGNTVAMVLAVPYLREPDIHALTRDGDYDDKRQQVRDAIRKHYDQLAGRCLETNMPVIAMGHLYAAGVASSDSERLIQMGNQSPVAADDFHKRFDYVALGHIHRPQFVAGLKHIRYSGSPVPLSFSERDDKKIVVELEIRAGKILQTDHDVPVFRKLVRFKGCFKEVKEKAEAYVSSEPLKTYGELQIEEEHLDPSVHADAARLVADWESQHIDILNYSITHTGEATRIHEQFGPTAELRDIQPLEVLNRMMESGGLKPEDQDAVRMAFLELLDMEDQREEE